MQDSASSAEDPAVLLLSCCCLAAVKEVSRHCRTTASEGEEPPCCPTAVLLLSYRGSGSSQDNAGLVHKHMSNCRSMFQHCQQLLVRFQRLSHCAVQDYCTR